MTNGSNQMTNKFETIKIINTVRLVIINEKNEVLLLRRDPMSAHGANLLTLPGGKVDDPLPQNDTDAMRVLIENLIRETKEEIELPVNPDEIDFKSALSNDRNENTDDPTRWSVYYFQLRRTLPSSTKFGGASVNTPAGERVIPEWHPIDNLPDDSEFAFNQRHELHEMGII